jgi:hypothetical protein
MLLILTLIDNVNAWKPFSKDQDETATPTRDRKKEKKDRKEKRDKKTKEEQKPTDPLD